MMIYEDDDDDDDDDDGGGGRRSFPSCRLFHTLFLLPLEVSLTSVSCTYPSCCFAHERIVYVETPQRHLALSLSLLCLCVCL